MGKEAHAKTQRRKEEKEMGDSGIFLGIPWRSFFWMPYPVVKDNFIVGPMLAIRHFFPEAPVDQPDANAARPSAKHELGLVAAPREKPGVVDGAVMPPKRDGARVVLVP
jgi:hypothetical protein